ncbi:MAG: sulfotransferase family 2 domain-containing protein [Cytophagia bacterium]|nr:sulfotransferase family 2 domain-containing protein [Cytophagia bacterium]
MKVIGKFENLDKDVKILSNRLGIPLLDLKKVKLNSSKHSNYSEYYTPELRKLVYNYYKEDFKNFGYNAEID